MTSKLVDVLAKILEGLSRNVSLEEVSKGLIKSKQFDENLLSAAFSLVYDKILLKTSIKKIEDNSVKRSIRMLSEDEISLLGLTNYNYLLHLMNLGLIDINNFETILNQISLFPELIVTRKEINWIILLSLVEFESELLPGSRFLLYSSDTVN
ncbi:MAG: hypothetical protein FD143_218 [Ignavibacteria bacterium]|nr:MAG: hypothetical protein FD143_218 [Ignavibacteria bacterium]KAF0162093.1 MAG: hypothetical protein FD188_342 [Ignavibacteria bacterium]